MVQKRYQIFVKEDYSFELTQYCRFWQEAVIRASALHASGKLKVYIFDSMANYEAPDVFQIDTSGDPVNTGHLSREIYDELRLTPIASLSLMSVTERLLIDNAVMLLRSLDDVSHEMKILSGEHSQIAISMSSGSMGSPLTRQLHPENDVALMVYRGEKLVAMAVFSRYIEDHRFPSNQSELCYELSLHTVFVEPQFRGLGIATGLANTIVNIARKDMKHLHQVLAVANIRLKPWFSALALTTGGEAVCDILSEAFVEMNDDVIEELMDNGLAISYQDAFISVESLV